MNHQRSILLVFSSVTFFIILIVWNKLQASCQVDLVLAMLLTPEAYFLIIISEKIITPLLTTYTVVTVIS